MGKDVHPCRVKTIRIAVSTVTDNTCFDGQLSIDFEIICAMGLLVRHEGYSCMLLVKVGSHFDLVLLVVINSVILIAVLVQICL